MWPGGRDGFPSSCWRDLPVLVGVLVQLPGLAGVSPCPRGAVPAKRCVAPEAGVGLLVEPGVRYRGEGGEQLGHLDAEDVGDGERTVDGDRLAGVLDLGVEGAA